MLRSSYVLMVNPVVSKLLVLKKMCTKPIKLHNAEVNVNIYLKSDISERVISIYVMILNFIFVKNKIDDL